MRISWIDTELAGKVREALSRGHASWDEVFERDGRDEVRAGAPPEGIGVPGEVWPQLAGHVARVERVREVVARSGIEAAARRFATSPHAIERAALLASGPDGDSAAIAGVLGCPVDEFVAYGHFLSRLVELGAATDPAGTVSTFERFVAEASRVVPWQASWTERLRFARDGLAALYVRVGRADDAEALYAERFDEEPGDTTVAIGAARAFLEAGDLARALVWLERAGRRAEDVGRDALAVRLRTKVTNLRARLN
jgi:tetratricopeptide repeat protein